MIDIHIRIGRRKKEREQPEQPAKKRREISEDDRRKMARNALEISRFLGYSGEEYPEIREEDLLPTRNEKN